jgi:hypothetical protein
MTRNMILAFMTTIFCLTISHATFADTVDVWTVKVNGKIVVNSNQTEIAFRNHPIQINLSLFNDSDTLQICYWTDSGMERYKWFYTLRDSINVFIDKFTNPIDSSIRCYPTPCKTFTDRKNFISFNIGYLKRLLKSRSVEKIFIEFAHDNPSWGESYLKKNICIISNHK